MKYQNKQFFVKIDIIKSVIDEHIILLLHYGFD